MTTAEWRRTVQKDASLSRCARRIALALSCSMGLHAGGDGKCFPGESELGERVVYSERHVRRGIRELKAADYLAVTKDGRKNVYWGKLPSASNSQNGDSVGSPPLQALSNAPGVHAGRTNSHGASGGNGLPSKERIEAAKGWIVERLTSLGPRGEPQLQAALDLCKPGPELTERRQALTLGLQQLLVEKDHARLTRVLRRRQVSSGAYAHECAMFSVRREQSDPASRTRQRA
jgi:hypothetical protein